MRMGEPELSELSELGRGGWAGRGAGLGRLSRSQGDARQPALYYSPPGTSYTIVERPASSHAAQRPRGTHLGARSPAHPPATQRKRPISPEQVLRLLGQGGAARRGRAPAGQAPLPASSPPSTTHHVSIHPFHTYLTLYYLYTVFKVKLTAPVRDGVCKHSSHISTKMWRVRR